jgi:hypothetical protein
MAWVSLRFQVSMATMTRDVANIAKVHPLSGILSNLGVILWCVGASICAFAAIILRNVKPRDTFWFLLSSSLLSAFLLLDDFFLFHEYLAPRHLSLNEKIVITALGIAVSAYLIKFRRFILRTNFSALVLALGFLTTSVVIDVILERWFLQLGHWIYFFEDGAKWIGIVFWCIYYVHTSYKLLVSTLDLPNNAIPSGAPTWRR